MSIVCLDVGNLRAVFSEMDLDHSGILSEKEIILGLSKLGIEGEESANLMKHLDSNKDGEISYEEIVEFLPEINALLREENEERKRAEVLQRKRKELLAKKAAQAKLMEERVLRKVKGIKTDDPNDLKRALAKALLVIDELRAEQDDTDSKLKELEHLRAYKAEIVSVHKANFPKSKPAVLVPASVAVAASKIRLNASIPSSRQPKKVPQGVWGKRK